MKDIEQPRELGFVKTAREHDSVTTARGGEADATRICHGPQEKVEQSRELDSVKTGREHDSKTTARGGEAGATRINHESQEKVEQFRELDSAKTANAGVKTWNVPMPGRDWTFGVTDIRKKRHPTQQSRGRSVGRGQTGKGEGKAATWVGKGAGRSTNNQTTTTPGPGASASVPVSLMTSGDPARSSGSSRSTSGPGKAGSRTPARSEKSGKPTGRTKAQDCLESLKGMQ